MPKYLLALFLTMSNVFAQVALQDLEKLHNDKEVFSSIISKKDIKRISQNISPETLQEHKKIFQNSMYKFITSGNKLCELRLLEDLHSTLTEAGLGKTEHELKEHFKILRTHNAIDDILYEILSLVNEDYFKLKSLDLEKKPGKLTRKLGPDLESNNLPDLFSGFLEFPDEVERCFYQEYMYVFNNISKRNEKKANLKDFKILTEKALLENLISLTTFNKIRYLQTKSNIKKRDIWLKDYLKIIFLAKNKMKPQGSSYEPTSLEHEDDFSSRRIKRFSRLTRRKLLYRKYDETQIILLAQVLQKASRRMGVDPDTETSRPVISQEFSFINSDGERTTYVEKHELDPQSQYNLARRLLRKDIVELQMMDIFVKQKITYEDIVMAAFETGYISIEELEFVVRYDDLWNPTKTKFERVSGFIFTMAGYSTFFLPPPWNITASLALGIVEGVVEKKQRNGEDHDNPATFIE